MPDPEPEELELLPDAFGLERGFASSSSALVMRLVEEALEDEAVNFEDDVDDFADACVSESGLEVLVFFDEEFSSSVAGSAFSAE